MTRRNMWRHGCLIRARTLEAQAIEQQINSRRRGYAVRPLKLWPFDEFTRTSDRMVRAMRRETMAEAGVPFSRLEWDGPLPGWL